VNQWLKKVSFIKRIDINGEFYDAHVSKVDEGFLCLTNPFSKYGGIIRTLTNHEIIPMRRSSDTNTCSIGVGKQGMYGWSHRAIGIFNIGSKINKGGIGYFPVDWDDFLDASRQFWEDDKFHNWTKSERGFDGDGVECAVVTYEMNDSVPNEKIRGTVRTQYMHPPKVWGKGAWVAKTPEDAMQMAMDFAESVS